MIGPLYRLRANRHEIDVSVSPLLQNVNRSKYKFNKLARIQSACRPLSCRSPGSRKGVSSQIRVSNQAFREDSNAPLGMFIEDWTKCSFELATSTCELKYYVYDRGDDDAAKEESVHPRPIPLGFLQSDTEVQLGLLITTTDRDEATLERLCLHTLEIRFHNKDSVIPKYVILGHPDEIEIRRWYQETQSIVSRKRELDVGWKRFQRESAMRREEEIELWAKSRVGESTAIRPNSAAQRRARLMNGKAISDLPAVFQRHCTSVSFLTDRESNGKLVLAFPKESLHRALIELGVDLSADTVARHLRQVEAAAHDLEDEEVAPSTGFLSFSRFRAVFESCRSEMLMPAAQVTRKRLLEILQESTNPFLRMLSLAEQEQLVDAAGADACRRYLKGAVLVRQNDPGNSMFVVLEGSLSVMVAFGAGASTTQREVAVLQAGAVMGEMSLVLGKPRSATCTVRSESSWVAELPRAALGQLLQARPDLALELQAIVHARDAANYCAAGRAAGGSSLDRAAAMAAYRQRLDRLPSANVPSASGPAGPSAGGRAAGPEIGGTVQSPRQRTAARRRPFSVCAAGSGRVAAKLAGMRADSDKQQRGRWIKGSSAYIYVVS